MSTIVATTRRVELDRLRGLAILLMIADHIALVTGLLLVHVSVGRLAMPLFFVLAGHLAHRLSGRHLDALWLGLVLPVLVFFVDRPNVLVWYVLCCVVLWAFDRARWPVWPLLVLALIFGANGWSLQVGSSYDPLMLLAFMVLGRLAPASMFFVGRRLPVWFAVLGRRPLTWYIGHALVLQLWCLL